MHDLLTGSPAARNTFTMQNTHLNHLNQIAIWISPSFQLQRSVFSVRRYWKARHTLWQYLSVSHLSVTFLFCPNYTNSITEYFLSPVGLIQWYWYLSLFQGFCI